MQRASVDLAVPDQDQILNPALINYPSINTLVVTVTGMHESVIRGFPLSITGYSDCYSKTPSAIHQLDDTCLDTRNIMSRAWWAMEKCATLHRMTRISSRCTEGEKDIGPQRRFCLVLRAWTL